MTDNMKRIVQDIMAELARAEHLYPIFPAVGKRGDHVWAAAIVAEEAGEVLQAANNLAMHGTGSIAHIRRELLHTAAMAIRYLENLEAVERQRINDADDGPASQNEVANEHVVYHQPQEGLTIAATTNDLGYSALWDDTIVFKPYTPISYEGDA